jgi:hypothetical protein
VNGVLLADSYIIFNVWKNCFPLLLNVHGVNNVRQTKMYTPEPVTFDVKIAIELPAIVQTGKIDSSK